MSKYKNKQENFHKQSKSGNYGDLELNLFEKVFIIIKTLFNVILISSGL